MTAPVPLPAVPSQPPQASKATKAKPAVPPLTEIGIPAAAPVTPIVAAPRKAAAPLPPVAKPAATPPPAVNEGSIDKRPHGALANEAAENEYGKAIAALRRGANTEAMTALQTALRFDANHVSARQALLSLLVRQQRLAEAQAVAEEGLAVDPSQSGWAMAVARLQLEAGKLAEAADTLSRHARYADQNADYQAFYAILMQKQKRFKESVERYRTALALRPAESRWWYGLGMSLEADQQFPEARTAFLRAREAGNLPADLASGVERHLR
jgi:MSHA biogenesis protein MshN